jgi:hypothetical protein
MVSSIASGAGSVAVLALHAFQTTFSTSGISEIILFDSISKSLALLSLTSGKVIGIYIILHSSRGGINSEPIRVNNQIHRIKSIHDIANATFLFFKAQINTGSYIFCKNLTIGICLSFLSFHFKKNIHKTGAKNSDVNNAHSIANIFVNAKGEKSFHSCHSNAKMGTNERIIISIANISGQATSFVDSIIIFVLSLMFVFSFQSNLL